MGREAESQVPPGVAEIIQAVRDLIPALYAMAESNCRVAEALIAAAGDDAPDEQVDEQQTYLDGTPVG